VNRLELARGQTSLERAFEQPRSTVDRPVLLPIYEHPRWRHSPLWTPAAKAPSSSGQESNRCELVHKYQKELDM